MTPSFSCAAPTCSCPYAPSSACGKPSTQVPMSRPLQMTRMESSGTTALEPRPSLGSVHQCPVPVTSSAQGQGSRSSHTADGRLISGTLHIPHPQLASPATPIPHTPAAQRTAQESSLLPSRREQSLGEARQPILWYHWFQPAGKKGKQMRLGQ